MVDELQPTKPISVTNTLAMCLAVTVAIIGAMFALSSNVRLDVLAGNPTTIFLLRSGMLALLGLATGHAVLSMASPGVGSNRDSWRIAIAAAGLFPLAAIIAMMTGDFGPGAYSVQFGLECMAYSIVGGAAIAAPMVGLLRKGAPTSPEQAGWLVGVASGGFGALAYNFRCSFDSIVYIGIWYTAAIAACAVAGRLIVPRLIRW